MKTRSVVIEGWLYWYTALGGALMTYLSTEETYKYMDPKTRFWVIALIGSTVTAFNSLKAFRSMTFGRHVGEQQDKEQNEQKTNS